MDPRTRKRRRGRGREEESSISSLGSFMETESVAKAFGSSSHSTLRQSSLENPKPTGSSKVLSVSGGASTSLPADGVQCTEDKEDKRCPHCRKIFSNSWAVPKHVLRVHDRSGFFHCSRCTFSSQQKDNLNKHEKENHRTCPFCNQIFLMLNKHIPACPKRPELRQ